MRITFFPTFFSIAVFSIFGLNILWNHPSYKIFSVEDEKCPTAHPLHVVKSATAPPFTIAVHEQRDIVSTEIISTGMWDVVKTRAIEKVLSNSSAALFVDVGANIGWFSLFAASLGRQVIAIEPMFANVQLLNASLCLNPTLQQHIILHNIAAGASTKNCHLLSDSDNFGDGWVDCNSNVSQDVVGAPLTFT
eukprot:TRINITY_DN15630_c0_g1_i2.p1 TRINITY_DN15630_c0_g1~~TRINITY_DN15630_c0_g1_i2.p1  ORF type:complete len:199 (-),score=30.94 TRINITY_DN15630_c0_g1_i2:416-991(-)